MPSLTYRLGCVTQSLCNVLALKVRIGGENFGFGRSIHDHADGRDWDAQSSDAGDSTHLPRIDCDACKYHWLLSKTVAGASQSRRGGRCGARLRRAPMTRPTNWRR